MQSSSATMVAVVLLVIGLLVGAGAGYVMGNNKTASSSETMTQANPAAMMDQTDGVTVGGAKMVRDRDIVDNAVNAKNVTTVVAAVKAAGLVDTLKSAGPFTVFAPNNDAFNKLPAGTVDTLLKPESKSQLVKILTYHVVPGTYTSAALRVMASKGDMLTTVQGEKLMPDMVNNQVAIKDVHDSVVMIESADVISSNGVTHVVSSLLMP